MYTFITYVRFFCVFSFLLPFKVNPSFWLTEGVLPIIDNLNLSRGLLLPTHKAMRSGDSVFLQSSRAGGRMVKISL